VQRIVRTEEDKRDRHLFVGLRNCEQGTNKSTFITTKFLSVWIWRNKGTRDC